MGNYFETIEFGILTLKEELESKANTTKKKDEANKLVEDIQYCLRHVDEYAYGKDLLGNLLISAGLVSGDYVKIDDCIVRNTQRELANRLRALLTGKAVTDLECTDVKDTVLPQSNWIYRGYCCFIRRCKRDYTIHFKCGKNGNVPTFNEVTEMMENMINEAE